MANDAIKLYNFYRRYLWNENDFAGWQTGQVEHSRGLFEGLMGAAVLDGFEPTLTGGLGINVAAGISCGPTGYLGVVNNVTAVTCVAPTASIERALVVVRPNVVPGDYIQKPTSPAETVPLTSAMEAAITVIRGVAANSPSYPATEANDVVLFGVRIVAGQVTLAETDIDYEVRDIPGKNSNFQQDANKYDDRLRPYRSTAKIVGVKPSQLEKPFARVFSYVNKRYPSIFPKTALGVYNGASGDAFYNLETGAVTGTDQASSAMTPQIPTAGNCIVACLGLSIEDKMLVAYGTIGTRAQCFAGIKSQVTSGAGSVSIPIGTKPVCFIVVGSSNGTAVTEIDVIDARGFGGSGDNSNIAAGYDVIIGAAAYATHATLAAAVADSGVGAGIKAILLDSFSLATTVSMSKANWWVDARPGVVATNAGAGTGVIYAASGITFNGIRMKDFTLGFQTNASGTYGRVNNVNFKNCTTAFDDALAGLTPTGVIEEA